MQRLRASREPFVTATVVRAAKPTSVRPGDSALVHADGTIEGFVGGVCAQSSVRLYAARALETGDAMLLRLIPGVAPADEPATPDGVVVAHNPCLSGGSLEISLEPHLVAPRMTIVGETPIARALGELAAVAGYDVGDESDAVAVIVASHGEDEEAVLMIEPFVPLRVPRVPAGECRLGHRGVQIVCAVVGADDLADVGGRGDRPRQRTGIHDGDPPSALAEFPGSRQTEDAAADDDDGSHLRFGVTSNAKRSAGILLPG